MRLGLKPSFGVCIYNPALKDGVSIRQTIAPPFKAGVKWQKERKGL